MMPNKSANTARMLPTMYKGNDEGTVTLTVKIMLLSVLISKSSFSSNQAVIICRITSLNLLLDMFRVATEPVVDGRYDLFDS